MKKALSLVLVLVFILIGCNQLHRDTSDQFSFAFLTDIHLQPEQNAVEGFQKAIDTINKLNPDFVLTGGDLVMDVLNQTYGRSDSLYNLYAETVKGFNMPLYNTVGNHEVYGWHNDEEGIEAHPEFGKRMFEKRIGKRYYSFDHKGWHFIILDAIYRSPEGRYIGKIDDEQVNWLKEDLQKLDKETPIAVSTHIPFITSRTQLAEGSLAASSRGSVITNSRDVLLEFWEYNLKLVLQGHLHFLEDIYINDDVHFITAGAVSGLWWRNKPDSTPEEGFLLVHVNGEEVDWEYVDYGWVPLVTTK